MTVLSIVVFILIFSFLVIIHELGHFWAARAAGVKVEEFGLGLPPRLWGRMKGKTLYSFNAIPFGGFVKLKGEGEDGGKDKDSMQTKNYGWRFLIIVAGVGMNLLAAYVLLCIGMWFGMPPLATAPQQLVDNPSQLRSRVIVVNVEPGLPAEKAGIVQGDWLIDVFGKPIMTVADLQTAVENKKQVQLTIERDGKEQNLTVATTKLNGATVIGVGADSVIDKVHYTAVKVPILAARDFYHVILQIGGALGGFVAHLFTTGKVEDGAAGPIGIARITAQAVKLGWLPVLQLMIFLSINLGLLNIFPFPALDGGRLVFLLAEIITGGRKVSSTVESVIHNLGFGLLLILIAVVTYRDVVSLFHV